MVSLIGRTEHFVFHGHTLRWSIEICCCKKIGIWIFVSLKLRAFLLYSGYKNSLFNSAFLCDFARGHCCARNACQYLFLHFLPKTRYASFKNLSDNSFKTTCMIHRPLIIYRVGSHSDMLHNYFLIIYSNHKFIS